MNRENVNLPRYVSLLKNLRAIAFFDPSLFPEMELKWIMRKYRYRNVGISRFFLNALPNSRRDTFRKKPFEVLEYPLREIKDFCELILELWRENDYIFPSMVLASCYVNPMLVLGRDSFKILEPFTAWCMTSTVELPDLEVKRNLRIIGYAILDFHEKVIREAYDFLVSFCGKICEAGKFSRADQAEFKNFLQKRRELAEKDGEKRFWRLKQEGTLEERPIIAYLDPLIVLTKVLRDKNGLKLARFVTNSSFNLSMALSLIPTFILSFNKG